MSFIDIKGNIEAREIASCREARGTTASSLTCNGVTAGVALELVALGDDPSKVVYVQATSTQTTTASDRIAAAVLGFIATLPYDGAQPPQSRSWVEANIAATPPAPGKSGATTIVGAARLSITKRSPGAGRAGLILVYQYDNDRMRMHYLEAAGDRFLYAGDGGVYDSGDGQYDASRARFEVGHFTRRDGPDQVAATYSYPNARVRIHVFEPTPLGMQPVNGWAGLYDSGEGQYELDQAKVVATDLDGDGLTDLVALYGYPDGSVRVHLFAASRNLALTSSSGVSALSAGTLAWGPSKVVAGRWYTDGRSSLAVLTPFSNGATEASVFRSVGGRTLTHAASQWTTPWYEQRTPASPIGLAMSPDFCSTHSCISNFPNGRGYVVMCADGQYSQSGGIQGACSHHGGTITHSGSSYHVANGGSLSTYSPSGSRASSGLSSYGSRTQYVSGYFRRNGTYVAPYYRRAPSRTSPGTGRGRRR